VQVRFPDSPPLGIEDWPSRRRPDAIEQASDSVAVTYPTDRATGAQLPARLRIRIVASEFTTPGAAEQLVEVPPRAYSKRVAFLMTPTRAGICRVNVEVYAIDAVFLGLIAVEAEAMHAPAPDAAYRVATLDLRMMTREPESAALSSTRRAAVTEVVRSPVVAASAPPAASILPDGSMTRASAPEAAAPHRPIRGWMGLASMAVVLTAAGVVMLHPHFATVPSPAPAAPTAPASPATSARDARSPETPAPAATPPPLVPAPRVPALPAASAAAPISVEDYVKRAVKNVLKELCGAYEAMDPDAAQQMFPTINMAALRMQLNKSQYKSVTCTFGEPTFQAVDSVAGTAKIRVDVKRVFEHSALDPKPDVSEQVASMRFSRAGPRGRWVVESAEYRPKPNGVK
jgi:hypothetical protein